MVGSTPLSVSLTHSKRVTVCERGQLAITLYTAFLSPHTLKLIHGCYVPLSLSLFLWLLLLTYQPTTSSIPSLILVNHSFYFAFFLSFCHIFFFWGGSTVFDTSVRHEREGFFQAQSQYHSSGSVPISSLWVCKHIYLLIPELGFGYFTWSASFF